MMSFLFSGLGTLTKPSHSLNVMFVLIERIRLYRLMLDHRNVSTNFGSFYRVQDVISFLLSVCMKVSKHFWIAVVFVGSVDLFFQIDEPDSQESRSQKKRTKVRGNYSPPVEEGAALVAMFAFVKSCTIDGGSQGNLRDVGWRRPHS